MKARLINRLNRLENDSYILITKSDDKFNESVYNQLQNYTTITGLYSLNPNTTLEQIQTLNPKEVMDSWKTGVKLLVVPELPSHISFFNQCLHGQRFNDYYILNPLFWIGERAIYNPIGDINVDDVVDLLTFEEDKKCFRNIMELRGNKSEDVSDAYETIMQKNYFGGQKYVEYLNTEIIKTVYCGGLATAGANYFPYLNQSIFPNIETIFTFDPDKTIFEYCFSRSFLENLKPKVQLVSKALSTKNTSLPFNFSREISFNGSGRVYRNAKTKVPSTSIDYFTGEGNQKPDLIQLTIMGYEIEALKGGKNTIGSQRPQIVIYGFWDALLYINSIVDDYVFRFGFYSEGDGYLIFYAIPKEVYIEK